MVDRNVPDKQRALILQGGGALGAYEAGAFKELSEKIPEIDAENQEAGRPLFDIVAGTSIGAINAAILVSHLKEDNNRSWNSASEKLQDFWNYISSDSPKRDVDFRIHWWNEVHKNDQNAASPEAARRYYSAKYFLQNGADRAFSEPKLILDEKFFDFGVSLPNNLWIRYSNDRLRESIDKYAKFPIATSNGEPRLLVVSADVADGATVTFDSYSKESEYGRFNKGSYKFSKRVITYDKGIELKHVMASASIPLFYDYEIIQRHKFWDGGILSNTPLREVLQAHRDYWFKTIGRSKPESKVPDLEVYIIGVWPSSNDDGGPDREEVVPSDYDGIKAKLYAIGLSDKTEYDEKTAIMVSDYIEIIKRIRGFALENIKNQGDKNAFTKDLQAFLDKEPAQSKGRDGGDRTYASLLNGRFKLADEVVRIELKNDSDGISNGAFDLTTKTIGNLMTQGENDAKDILERILRILRESKNRKLKQSLA
jgi:NTE family protein